MLFALVSDHDARVGYHISIINVFLSLRVGVSVEFFFFNALLFIYLVRGKVGRRGRYVYLRAITIRTHWPYGGSRGCGVGLWEWWGEGREKVFLVILFVFFFFSCVLLSLFLSLFLFHHLR